MIIKIGIWEIDEYGLIGRVNPSYDYNIDRTRLWEIRDYEGYKVWNWLVNLTEKDWITSENIHELNTAFFFGLDYFKEYKTKENLNSITSQTLFIQKQLLEIRDKMVEPEVNENGLVQFDIEGLSKCQTLMNNHKF